MATPRELPDVNFPSPPKTEQPLPGDVVADPQPIVSDTLTFLPVPAPCERETLAPNAPAGASVGRDAVPGYEILGELGRGGMGVVYKAKQAKLGRLVALKMILTGVHASVADLARFRTEAESIARLQHPHIVQIHEIGEHGGLPYFSLEFCAGGSLARKLDGTPLPPKEAAALVETLARAMQAAHEKGVIHRDLKPANVLLSEDGTPKVTDFGLAKKVGEAGQTASGAVMGTPSYMAPEQAGGRSVHIGPLVDVYALGAILYECLTGRPPFRGPTAVDTVMQVIADEPVPVRQLQPQVPADVETICLKCLQKELGKRYDSAAALADDLRRFGEGRPVVARPVGRRERATKWVRRNPLLSGMSAAVVLALLAGAVVSVAFGIDARQQAVRATSNEAKAIAKEKELATANETLTRTADDLRGSRETLEVTLARSLLRPLAVQSGGVGAGGGFGGGILGQGFGGGFQGQGSSVQSGFAGMGGGMTEMSGGMIGMGGGGMIGMAGVRGGNGFAGQGGARMVEIEWQAMWELARSRNGRVGYRFVEEASRTPGTSRQLRDRAAVSLPAAVGLDETRRAEVEKLLLARLADAALSAKHRRDLTLALSAWDGLSGPGASDTARQLIAAISETNDETALSHLLLGLSLAAPRLKPEEAVRAAAALTEAMDPKNPSAPSLQSLVEGLSSVVARLEPKEAAQAASQAAAKLIKGMKDPKNTFALWELAAGLSSVMPSLEPDEAAKVTAQAADALTQAMKDPKNVSRLGELAQGLSSMAVYLGPKEISQATSAIIQAMQDPKNAHTLVGQWGMPAMQLLAVSLSMMAVKMEPKDAAQATTAFIQAMRDPKNEGAMISLAQGLWSVAARLEPKEAAGAAAAIIQVMKDTKNPATLSGLAQSLSSMELRLEPEQCITAAAIILAMKDTKDAVTLSSLAQSLSSMAARLDPKQCAPAAAVIIQAVRDQTGNAFGVPAISPNLSKGLISVAARLEPKEAAEAVSAIIQAMKNTKNAIVTLPNLASGLSAVAARLDPKDAAQTAAAIIQVMKDTKDAGTLIWWSQSLSSVAARLDPKEAAQSASAIIQAMKNTQNADTVMWLAQGLSAVAARLEPKEAAKTATAIIQAMKDAKNATGVPTLLVGLLAAASRLDPRARLDHKEAAEAAAAIIEAMRNTKNAMNLPTLVQNLLWVDPKAAEAVAQGAAQAAVALTQAIEDTDILHASNPSVSDPDGLQQLFQGLSAVAAYLAPKEAARAFAVLTQAIRKPMGATPLQHLAEALRAVTARLDPKEALQAATALIQAMKDAKYAAALRPQALAEAMSVAAAHMAPKDVAQTAAVLLQAMKDPKNASALASLAHGVSAVAPRMAPKEAAQAMSQAAVAIAFAMKNAKDEDALVPLVGGLAAVADGLGPEAVSQATAALAYAMKNAKDENVLLLLVHGLSALSPHMGLRDAVQAAACLTHAIVQRERAEVPDGMTGPTATGPTVSLDPAFGRALGVVLSPVPPSHVATVASALAFPTGTGHPLLALGLFVPAVEPLPCRLSTQQLVELLKMPTCIGDPQRIVLDQLGNRYRTSFADVWEFVRFASDQNLGVDFTTPPQYSEPAEEMPANAIGNGHGG